MVLGLKALSAAIEDKPTPQTVEAGVVKLNEPFRRLGEKELEGFIAKL